MDVVQLMLSYGNAFRQQLFKKLEDWPLVSVTMADTQLLKLCDWIKLQDWD